LVARRSGQEDLAVIPVAFLFVKEISFQSLGNRILARLPVLTLSFEEAARPVGKVCDALTLSSMHASLLARLVAFFARPIAHILLAFAPVAFLSVMACAIDFALLL